MIIDSFRKVEYVLFTRRYLSNSKSRHNGDKATGGDIRLYVLQKITLLQLKTLHN